MSDRCRCGHLDRIHLSGRYACRLTYHDAIAPGRQSTLRETCDCQRFRPERWTDAHTWWRHLAVKVVSSSIAVGVLGGRG